jgi:hypothetical protein
LPRLPAPASGDLRITLKLPSVSSTTASTGKLRFLERQSRLWPFALGAIGFAVLLLVE